jgi:hypothetical protein
VICFSKPIAIVVGVLISFGLDDLGFAFGDVGQHLTGIFRSIFGLGMPRAIGQILMLFHQPNWFSQLFSSIHWLTHSHIKRAFGIF